MNENQVRNLQSTLEVGKPLIYKLDTHCTNWNVVTRNKLLQGETQPSIKFDFGYILYLIMPFINVIDLFKGIR